MEKYKLLSNLNRFYYDVQKTEKRTVVRRRSDRHIVFAISSQGEKTKIFVDEKSFPNMVRLSI